MSDPDVIVDPMSVWTDGSLINHEVIDNMTPEQLQEVLAILEELK
jgi:hypothetical protein